LLGLKKLKAMGITAIVNMRMHADYDDAAHEGIKYLHLPTVDNTPPPLEVLIKGADFIDTEIKITAKYMCTAGKALVAGRQWRWPI